MQSFDRLLPREHWLPLAFLTALSFVTFVHGFSNPPALFWDENYHIASAQKYINGVFFMEPHPPLGKLLIAAGEVLLDRNANDDQFITTDYATNPPQGFDFTGYRLFPVLLAWLTAPITYAIFFLLTRNAVWSMLLGLVYPLDNALLVHSRSAMLDSTLLFFAALTILAFLLLLREKRPDRFAWTSALFGAAFACGLTTKAFMLLFVLLLPVLCWTMIDDTRKILRFLGIASASFAAVFVGVWYVHFALARQIVPALPEDGYYQASIRGAAIIDAGQTAHPLAFPILLQDALSFVSHYQAGVPALDLSKDDENGSPWFLWPIGARTINYRWETPDGYSYRYLYLVANPVTWAISFLAVLVGCILFLSPYIVRGAEKSPLHLELGTFLGLYVAFLAAVSRIDRVMYLYHYFLPLYFSFILIAIVFMSLRHIDRFHMTDDRRTVSLLAMAVAVFLGFQAYRPFTYYTLMTDDDVTKRAIVRLWDMHCVECDAPHLLATPAKR